MKILNLKNKNGITLIALVITIIVLLILAGISIQMLSGDNGLLNRTTEARSKTIHANVYEKLQLEELAHLTDKSTSRDTSTLIGYLQSKSIIGDEIGEDTGKYQVNVTSLLGQEQALGNGDATAEVKDVYLLEQQSNKITYTVIYYGNRTSENFTLGNLIDDNNLSKNTVLPADESTKIYNAIKDKDGQEIVEGVEIDGITTNFLGVYEIDAVGFIEYNNQVYIVSLNKSDYSVSNVVKTDIDLTKFGVYTTASTDVLITPNEEDEILHFPKKISDLTGNLYYFKENGTDIDLNRTVTGNIIYQAKDKYYNESGEVINVINAEGPLTLNNMYYLKDNGELDMDKPFTEGYKTVSNPKSYYDVSGKLVKVGIYLQQWNPSNPDQH